MTTTINKLLTRRTVLRGAVGGTSVALGLPLLEAMIGPRGASAEGTALDEPIFGLFYWANGTPWHAGHGAVQGEGGYPDLWTPATTGPGYAASPLLAPIAAHLPSVATGLEPKTEVPPSPPGQEDGHMRGFMNALTADRIRPEGFDHPSHTLTVLRPTIDQVIARHEQFYGGAPSRFRSLELGVSEARFHDYGHWNRITFTGPDEPMPQISSPTALYSLLFDVPADLAAVGRRARLIDAVLADAQSLRARLGANDRMRLDSHLANLDEVQRRLELTSGTCDLAPAPPGDGDLIGRTEQMATLLAVALQCGLTRVFSFMLTSPATTHVFSNLGSPNDMHATCHNGEWENVRKITEYQMQAFARLLDILAAAPDPMGTTILDRALIYGCSEYGEGWQHSTKEMPILLVGGCNGKIVRGYHYREQDGNVCKTHVTILRALGIDTPSYGFNGAETTEHLTGILA
ncbi:MAG: DUF1552 domain-containing protein [Myxococcales bacterium]|nr:DUF1552 domain-containing protein [Myxococcales bacterium]